MPSISLGELLEQGAVETSGGAIVDVLDARLPSTQMSPDRKRSRNIIMTATYWHAIKGCAGPDELRHAGLRNAIGGRDGRFLWRAA
jgi:hypothetical protein